MILTMYLILLFLEELLCIVSLQLLNYGLARAN
jgi:hypothetical protein